MDFRSKISNDKPLVTIGVLSYNYSAYVIDTLNSIFEQSYDNIQLFIIDDFSTDNSVALINDWLEEKNINCQFIIHEKNYGRNRACNTIISRAEGKYIALFSSDDIMLPLRIEALVNEMENVNDEYAVCYTDAELMNEHGEYRGLYSKRHNLQFLEGDVFEEYYKRRFVICAPAIFFRKNIFKIIGQYDEKVTIEDYEMWMRLLPNFKVKYCDYVGIKYRIKENFVMSATETLTDRRTYHRNRIYIYCKLFKQLTGQDKWLAIRNDLVIKINYHLIHLKGLSVGDFWRIVLYLIRHSFYNFSVVKILKLEVKALIDVYKSNLVPANN